MQRVKPKLGPNPEANASFLSRITYMYVSLMYYKSIGLISVKFDPTHD